MSHNLLSVSEIPPTLRQDTALAWNIHLPEEVDRERLVVDMTRVRFGGRTAGLSGVTLGEYPGRLGDGDAKLASPYLEQQPGEEGLAPGHHWPLARIDLNRRLLNQQVSDEMFQGGSLEQAWAVALSAGYRQGFREIAKHNLFHRGHGGEMAVYTCLAGAGVILDSLFLKLVASGMFVYLSGSALAQNLRNSGNNQIERKRWSIFPRGCYQVDRLAVASVYSALPVIRCRE